MIQPATNIKQEKEEADSSGFVLKKWWIWPTKHWGNRGTLVPWRHQSPATMLEPRPEGVWPSVEWWWISWWCWPVFLLKDPRAVWLFGCLRIGKKSGHWWDLKKRHPQKNGGWKGFSLRIAVFWKPAESQSWFRDVWLKESSRWYLRFMEIQHQRWTMRGETRESQALTIQCAARADAWGDD